MPRILIAEDDEAMRNFIALALTKAGHEIESCPDGDEALAILEKPQNKPFDLLLTDIVMPGIDGIELSQRATDLFPGIKVMFITGFAAVALGENKPDNLSTHVLSKPFHLKNLVEQIEQLLAA